MTTLVAACATSGPHVAAGPGAHPATADAPVYLVRTGDTLYSIAFRLGTDYRTLARQNHIAPPFVIHPGQRLVAPRATKADAGPAAAGEAHGGAVPSGAAGGSSGPPSRRDAPSPLKTVTATREPMVFVWPAAGRVLRAFGAGNDNNAAGGTASVGGNDAGGSTVRVNNKGIDIAGVAGDPVVAAADGEVVYAGDGLRGYGALLILKHGDLYLTAYGHNDRLLVREGDSVKARQKIAEIGSNGSDESSLHFEIRREGRPVDPLRLLPRR